jgi:hypothetical protein
MLAKYAWQETKEFSKKILSPPVVSAIAIDQLGDFISSKKVTTQPGGPLKAEEEVWVNKINLPEVHPITLPKKSSCWQLQFPPPPPPPPKISKIG